MTRVFVRKSSIIITDFGPTLSLFSATWVANHCTAQPIFVASCPDGYLVTFNEAADAALFAMKWCT